ncbi:ribonucleases p mrp protein subunit pop3 kda subunit [Lentinula edodes]|uniref:Ribonucleases p mrp protein subunit pop3 kDa subunit n=1 Tax=Lentinula edodes TaxID=5353 RepID=A0A1Q3DV29_LENED|nr:ribonucleases p mrp protein subunit pop3 kda subunit [Lentinula edodes]
MSVKVHTHGSNRERPNQAERKVVFKGVLDNPFRLHWPSVPINLQNLVLAQILSLLDGVSEYQHFRSQMNRKRKGEPLEEKHTRKKTRRVTTNDLENSPIAGADQGSSSADMQVDVAPYGPPAILAHLTLGINQVTKRLEVLDNPFAAYNSTKPPDSILLVPLPQGAEFTLSKVMGIRRVAVMAVNSDAPELSNILSLVTSVPVLTASWLAAAVSVAEIKSATPIIPTHIKQLRTTAPKDMKVAKEQRAAGRVAAKERKKDKSKPVAK